MAKLYTQAINTGISNVPDETTTPSSFSEATRDAKRRRLKAHFEKTGITELSYKK